MRDGRMSEYNLNRYGGPERACKRDSGRESRWLSRLFR